MLGGLAACSGTWLDRGSGRQGERHHVGTGFWVGHRLGFDEELLPLLVPNALHDWTILEERFAVHGFLHPDVFPELESVQGFECLFLATLGQDDLGGGEAPADDTGREFERLLVTHQDDVAIGGSEGFEPGDATGALGNQGSCLLVGFPTQASDLGSQGCLDAVHLAVDDADAVERGIGFHSVLGSDDGNGGFLGHDDLHERGGGNAMLADRASMGLNW